MRYGCGMKTDTDRAFDYLAAHAGISTRRAKVFHALLIATMIDPANPTLPLCRRCAAPMLGRQKNAEYCSDRCRMAAMRSRKLTER